MGKGRPGCWNTEEHSRREASSGVLRHSPWPPKLAWLLMCGSEGRVQNPGQRKAMGHTHLAATHPLWSRALPASQRSTMQLCVAAGFKHTSVSGIALAGRQCQPWKPRVLGKRGSVHSANSSRAWVRRSPGSPWVASRILQETTNTPRAYVWKTVWLQSAS